MDTKRIRLSDATAGMLVAEDVVNDVGQLIFPAEARLTDKAIARMQFHILKSCANQRSLMILTSSSVMLPLPLNRK